MISREVDEKKSVICPSKEITQKLLKSLQSSFLNSDVKTIEALVNLIVEEKETDFAIIKSPNRHIVLN